MFCKKKDENDPHNIFFNLSAPPPPTKKNLRGTNSEQYTPTSLSLLYILQLMHYRYDSTNIRKHKKNNTRQSINFTLTSEEYEELIATPWVMIIPT